MEDREAFTRLADDPWVLRWFTLRSGAGYGGYGDYMTIHQEVVRRSNNWFVRKIRGLYSNKLKNRFFLRRHPWILAPLHRPCYSNRGLRRSRLRRCRSLIWPKSVEPSSKNSDSSSCLSIVRPASSYVINNIEAFKRFLTAERSVGDRRSIQQKMDAVAEELMYFIDTGEGSLENKQRVLEDVAVLRRVNAVIQVSNAFAGLQRSEEYRRFIDQLGCLCELCKQLMGAGRECFVAHGVNPHIDTLRASDQQLQCAAILSDNDRSCLSIRGFDKRRPVRACDLPPGTIIVQDYTSSKATHKLSLQRKFVFYEKHVEMFVGRGLIVHFEIKKGDFFTDQFYTFENLETVLFRYKVFYPKARNQVKILERLRDLLKKHPLAERRSTIWNTIRFCLTFFRRICFQHRYSQSAVDAAGGLKAYCSQRVADPDCTHSCSGVLALRLGQLGEIDLGKSLSVLPEEVLPVDFAKSDLFTDDPYEAYYEREYVDRLCFERCATTCALLERKRFLLRPICEKQSS